MQSSLTFVAAVMLSAMSAASQNVQILYPVAGGTVPSGQNFTVQVAEQSSLTGRIEVGIAIGVQLCTATGAECIGSSNDTMLGDVLLVSPFDPQSNQSLYGPFQNFSVAVPSSYAGQTLLSVAHFYLLGASSMPVYDVANVTVNIV